MSSPIERKPSLLRAIMLSRRLVMAAFVVGTLLWFIVGNNDTASVTFPFGLGRTSSSVGVVVLLSAAAGALATALIMTMAWAWRRYRAVPKNGNDPAQDIPEDRPPADYAAQTPAGFPDARWPAR